MSSTVDLPGIHNGPVFVSSPMSSVVDVSKTSQERPDPTPIQKLPSDSGETGSSSDRLGPGWKPSASSTSLSSTSSVENLKPQRRATWMTARETVIRESLHGQTIEEGDEEEHEEDEEEERADEAGEKAEAVEEQDEDIDDANEHYSLAKVISHESCDGAGVQDNSQGQGTTRRRQEAGDKALTVSDTTAKEPFSRSLSKAGTRFGRALLNRTPTGLKRQNGMPLRDNPQQRESMCSVDKDCHGSTENPPKAKKHVRFLTKVQHQIASSRQPTLLSTHPIVKQDRMIVRKEVTERPGPHVFNSDTARRLERQSQGWKEWWCVLKSPPVGEQEPVTKLRKKSKSKKRVEKGRLEFYYNHVRRTLIVVCEKSFIQRTLQWC